ncbi:MAG: hypothetical protein OEX19_03240 [Gammaproteobacteria bacterium]|nr:hypothetical protein [Gammaproteobacteria bacterium]
MYKNSLNAFSRLLLAIIAGGATLSGCEQLLSTPVTDNSYRNVNVSTNATLVAMRDGEEKWGVRIESNREFSPSSNSIILSNAQRRYAVLVVCPSSDRETPHRVYYYLGVVGELGDIDHQCRKSEAKINRDRVYGSVKGLDVNKNQKARLALGDNRGEWAYEAYAFENVAGIYDILGYLATVQPDGSVKAERLIKAETVTLGSTAPNKVDVDFSVLTGSTKTSEIPPQAYALATVSGMPGGVVWDTEVNFKSKNQSYLNLAKSSQTPLSFFGFPLYAVGTGSLTPLQSEEEGHEFVSRIYDNDKRVTSAVSHFFKEPHNIDTKFASGGLSVNAVNSLEHDQGVSINASWNAATDNVYGMANLYHLIVKGTTASAPVCNICGGGDSTLLEWHVIATPGWFNTQGTNLEFTLPPVFDLTDAWSRTWNFSVGSELDWELHAYFSSVDRATNSTSNDSGAEALLKYLFGRRYINGLSYAELIARRS